MRKITTILSILFLVAACGEKVNPEEEKETEIQLSATPTSVTASPDDRKAVVEIKSNASWKVACSDVSPTLDTENWLVGYTKYGLNNEQLVIEFTENASIKVTRSAKFIITAGEKKVEVNFTQNHVNFTPVMEVTEKQKTVDYSATGVSFSVHSNVPWTVSSTSDWIKSYTTTGSGDGEINASFDIYTDSEKDRTANLTLKSDAGEIVLTINQTKAPKGENAKNVTAEEFLAAPVGTTELYRLSGFVELLFSNTYGSMRIKDATGESYIYCLKTSKDGEEGKFQSLGIEVGDYIVAVGNKASFVGGVELVNGYHESHKTISKISIAEYLTKPDGNANWYRIKGIVSNITDSQNGRFTLSDGGSSVTVDGLLPGIGGKTGQFGSMNITEGATLTIVAPQKSGSSVVGAYYVSHTGATLKPGILARWQFDEKAAEELHTDLTWTGESINPESKTDAYGDDNKAGDGGRYIDAYEGKGRFSYVQKDKTALDPVGDKSSRVMFYTGQPAVLGAVVGDYFLLESEPGNKIPAGTDIKFSFCMRPSGTGPGYFYVEYFNGVEWRSAGGLEKSTKDGYTYNLARATNEQTLTTCNLHLEKDVDKLSVKINVSVPVTAGGASFELASSYVRFRGVVSGKDLSPVFEIVK